MATHIRTNWRGLKKIAEDLAETNDAMWSQSDPGTPDTIRFKSYGQFQIVVMLSRSQVKRLAGTDLQSRYSSSLQGKYGAVD